MKCTCRPDEQMCGGCYVEYDLRCLANELRGHQEPELATQLDSLVTQLQTKLTNSKGESTHESRSSLPVTIPERV